MKSKMKFELTEEETDVIEEALALYATDIAEDLKTYNNDPENVDFYAKAIKTFSNFQKQLSEQDK